MTFNELLEKIRFLSQKIDVSSVNFLAIQVNITGDNGGVFYIEIKDGKTTIEPYDYRDRSCGFTINMDNFNKLLDGKLDSIAAFTLGKLKVDGDLGKAIEFSNLIKNI